MKEEIKKYILKIMNKSDATQQEVEAAAEYILPSVIFNISPKITKMGNLNENTANKFKAPTGIDNIIFNGDGPLKFVQVKTGSDSLDSKKIKEDSLKVYKFLVEETISNISKAYEINEDVAQIIQELLLTKGFEIVFISAKKEIRDISDKEIILFKESDVTKKIVNLELPWTRKTTLNTFFNIPNTNDNAIIYDNGHSLDVHMTLKDLINAFDIEKLGQLELIFEKNVRGHESGTSRRVEVVINSINKTLSESPEDIINYNNGITILAEEVKIQTLPNNINTRRVFLKNPSIVNGQQTFRTIIEAYHRDSDNDKFNASKILLRVKEVCNDNDWYKIAEATNRMIQVSDIDLLASTHKFRKLTNDLLGHNIFVETRYKLPKGKMYEKFLTIKFEELFAISYMIAENKRIFSNIRTKIIDEFNNDEFESTREFLSIKNVKKIKEVIELFIEVAKFEVQQNASRLLVYTIVKSQNNGDGKSFKDKSHIKSIIPKAKNEIKKLSEEFKDTGERKMTNAPDVDYFVENAKKILIKYF